MIDERATRGIREDRMSMALAEAGYPGRSPYIYDDLVGTRRVGGLQGIPVATRWRAMEVGRIGLRTPVCFVCTERSARSVVPARGHCTASVPFTEDCGSDRPPRGALNP